MPCLLSLSKYKVYIFLLKQRHGIIVIKPLLHTLFQDFYNFFSTKLLISVRELPIGFKLWVVHQAWKAAGFSSFSTDYFSPEDAVLVDEF